MQYPLRLKMPRMTPKYLEIVGYCQEGVSAYDEADDCADKALKLDPASASALNLRGLVAFKRGDVGGRRRFFQKAIEADPGFGGPYTNRGILKWAIEETAEALDLLEKGLSSHPRARMP